jgi:hypothetical protein
LVLSVLVFLRSRDSRFEIRATDIVVAVLPVVIILLVSGKIQSFEFGESGLKIETAFSNASASAIKSQVTPLAGLPVEPVAMNRKGGIEDIPDLIAKKTEGLTFRIGYGEYWGPAILSYLQRLTQQGFLKYIVIQNEDGTFYAMVDARQLNGVLTANNAPFNADELAAWLSRGNREAMQQLPGFVSSENAVRVNDDKRRALRAMELLNVDTLPVVDENNRYSGIVNRSRLTASLILDVAESVAK